MKYYRSTSHLDINGTIYKIPISKCWYLFYISAIVVAFTMLSTDWGSFKSILLHVLFSLSIPVMLFALAWKIYETDHLKLAAIVRKIQKREEGNYYLSRNIYDKKSPIK